MAGRSSTSWTRSSTGRSRPPARRRRSRSTRRCWAELYRFYLPYPMEKLRESNRDHAKLVKALSAGDPDAAARVTRKHVRGLHQTMFVGLG